MGVCIKDPTQIATATLTKNVHSELKKHDLADKSSLPILVAGGPPEQAAQELHLIIDTFGKGDTQILATMLEVPYRNDRYGFEDSVGLPIVVSTAQLAFRRILTNVARALAVPVATVTQLLMIVYAATPDQNPLLGRLVFHRTEERFRCILSCSALAKVPKRRQC